MAPESTDFALLFNILPLMGFEFFDLGVFFFASIQKLLHSIIQLFFNHNSTLNSSRFAPVDTNIINWRFTHLEEEIGRGLGQIEEQ